MVLPNVERAFIDRRKLKDYCLSSQHSVGRNKAEVFRAALGFAERDAATLESMILQALPFHDAEHVRDDSYGRRYQVDLPLASGELTATVRTAWIIRTNEDFPRLTTAYVLGR